jgi:hypothetical protein
MNSDEQWNILQHLLKYHAEVDRVFQPQPSLSRAAAKEIVADVVDQSGTPHQFRNAMVLTLASLAAAGVANYWPTIRTELRKLRSSATSKAQPKAKPRKTRRRSATRSQIRYT